MATQSPLGKLVNTLVGRRSSRLDHIQDSAFIRAQSNDFTSNFPAHLGSLCNSLQRKSEKAGERMHSPSTKLLTASDPSTTYPLSSRRLGLELPDRRNVSRFGPKGVSTSCHGCRCVCCRSKMTTMVLTIVAARCCKRFRGVRRCWKVGQTLSRTCSTEGTLLPY